MKPLMIGSVGDAVVVTGAAGVATGGAGVVGVVGVVEPTPALVWPDPHAASAETANAASDLRSMMRMRITDIDSGIRAIRLRRFDGVTKVAHQPFNLRRNFRRLCQEAVLNRGPSKWRFRLAALAASTALLAPIAGIGGTAHADDPDPLAFQLTNAQPHFDATGYTQRLWGPTRYGTSLAAVYYDTANAPTPTNGWHRANDTNGPFPGADRTSNGTQCFFTNDSECQYNWFGPFSPSADAIVVTAGGPSTTSSTNSR
jgi:hypothetical protein